jgi:CRP-like cAMP-binding protein
MAAPTGNLILDKLDAEECEDLLASGRLEALSLGDEIFAPGDRADRVYFVCRGVISIVTEAANGEAAEGGVTGREAAAGLLEALGSGVIQSRGTVQAPGAAWRVSAERCQALFRSSAIFRDCLSRVTEFQTIESRQSLLCRSYHTIEQRLARWLLEMDDRRGAKPGEPLHLTQEYLALMLAAQRTSVSTAAHRLKAKGLLRYLRGKIELQDKRGLEAAACACRKTIRQEAERILGATEPRSR